MAALPQVDEVLKAAIERGDVPGVVAMAATRDGAGLSAAPSAGGRCRTAPR